ncbi:MAG: tRNA (adenosine(37)-N6)-threonylcarbamoyltransferase complex dimerization subunit type 1 TsaB [Alphaproteobacteria bacterium]|nr:tRNA (adenosine(37)-N6)-threonylcarbamoyltransferase complex dimerization subunit type 1 TsaB [Alphaproteobacteria bacterium]
MLVLAFDSATSACSAALWADGAVLARRFSAMARGQSEALVPMIAEVLAEAGKTMADIDLLAVTVGPGAFTGIRIGLATARALALAAAKPVAGITTPEAVAAAVPTPLRDGRTILVVLDSRREELWIQPFAPDLTALESPSAANPAQIAARFAGVPLVLAGDGADLVRDLLPGAIVAEGAGAPDAAIVAVLAAGHWAGGTHLAAEPLYLRPPDVTMPAGCLPA